MNTSLRAHIDAAPMRTTQWTIVVLCTLLNALDGFDVLAMAFTASRVSKDFGLTGGQLGLLLSAGLMGMAVGSLVLGPVADRIGRRPVLLLSVGLSGVGMLLSATANDATQLGIWRIVTGLGIGGVLASISVLVSEFSSRRWRGLAISIYTAGYGVGATIGGSAAVWLQARYSWHAVFLAGGIVSLVLLGLALRFAPESVDFLSVRRPRGYEAKLERLAQKLGVVGVLEVLPHPAASATGRAADRQAGGNPLAQLFTGANRRVTLLVWAGFFTVMFGFYFINSWTPKLLVTAGLSESQGIIGGLMLTLGGTIGSLLFGALAAKWAPRSVMLAFTVLAAITAALFISSVGVLPLAFAVGVLLGGLINGCIAGLYVITPGSYTAEVRSTGVGWGIGIGRVGAILAPIATGALLDAGWSPKALYIAVGAVLLVAAVAVYALPRRPRVEEAPKEPAYVAH